MKIDPKLRLEMHRRIDLDTGCWEWTGGRRDSGYGRICIGSRGIDRRTVSVHRYAYQVYVGKIPSGSWVLHKCDNPPCFNPDHLFLGDRKLNTEDRDRKGRNKKALGEHNGGSLLTDRAVESIRREFVPRKVTRKMLAKKYGVAEATIKNVVCRINWKHVLPPAPEDR